MESAAKADHDAAAVELGRDPPVTVATAMFKDDLLGASRHIGSVVSLE